MSIDVNLNPAPITSEAEPSLITGEDLAEMENVSGVELVKGKLVCMSPVGHVHGFFESNFAIDLGTFVKQHKLGRVLTVKSAFTSAVIPILFERRMWPLSLTSV